MADDWIELPFSEAVLLNPPTPLKRGAIYPFVDMAAVKADARDVTCSEQREFNGSGSRFQDRDTLMARITPCLENGKLARFRAPIDQRVGHGSTEFIVVRGKPEVTDNDFAYYLTISPEIRSFAISQMTGSSGRQRVPTDSLGGISVLIPSLKEQRKIVTVLSDLDDKIAVNERMNTTLEAMARALFQSWFVDFDPVRAKLDGSKHACIDEPTANLFPDTFQDSELGNIPKGWQVAPLKDYIDVTKGRSYRSEELSESKTALVTLKSFMRGGGYRADGLKPYTGDYRENQRVLPGDLIVAFTDVTQAAEVIGKPALIRDDNRFESLVASLDVGIVRTKNKHVSLPFLYCLFLTSEFQAHAYSYSTGTTVLHLGAAALPSFLSVIPPINIAIAFSEQVSPIFRLIDENSKQVRTLSNLRDTLLPKLLSGELSVENLQS